jgi:transcriptional regulator with XRE-family HTH domain
VAAVTQDPEAWARLGAKIREQREALGMSRRQLSEAAGVSEKSIQVAEEGRAPRARWPQSLRLIEPALRWAPGSMMEILAGGEPEPIHDLFSIAEVERMGVPDQMPMFPDAGPGETEEFSSNHTRSAALARLPKALRAGLGDVLSFGSKARAYGVEEYERSVEGLILDMTRRPIAYEGASRDPGHLMLWQDALRRDPFLRREREERMRAAARERRRLDEAAHLYRARNVDRDVVVGGTDSAEVLRELRKLAEEVAELGKKVNSQGAVPGVDRSFTEDEMEQQPKPREP